MKKSRVGSGTALQWWWAAAVADTDLSQQTDSPSQIFDLPSQTLTNHHEHWPNIADTDLQSWTLTHPGKHWLTIVNTDSPLQTLTHNCKHWPAIANTDPPLQTLTDHHKHWPTIANTDPPALKHWPTVANTDPSHRKMMSRRQSHTHLSPVCPLPYAPAHSPTAVFPTRQQWSPPAAAPSVSTGSAAHCHSDRLTCTSLCNRAFRTETCWDTLRKSSTAAKPCYSLIQLYRMSVWRYLGCCVVFREVQVGPKIPAGGKRESPYLMLHTHHQNDSVMKTSSSMKSFFIFYYWLWQLQHVVHHLWHLKKKVAQIGLNPGLSADRLNTLAHE